MNAVLLAAVASIAFAKEEMSYHLRLAEAKIDCEIVEDGSLKDEECRVEIKGGKVKIAGGRMNGCLYGVYSFLERELGIRWYEQLSGPYVPRKGTPRLSDKMWTEKPALEYRFDQWPVRRVKGGNSCGLFFLRNRRNSFGVKCLGTGFEDKVDVRFRSIGRNCHTYFHYLPPMKGGRGDGWTSNLGDRGYFTAHPEWYSLDKSGRRSSKYQLCLMNEGMRAEFFTNVCAEIERCGRRGRLMLELMDVGGTICHCPACREAEKTFGSPGGPHFDFAINLARRLGPLYPDVIVCMSAYRRDQSQHPPTVKVDWPGNMAVRMAPVDVDFSGDFRSGRNAVDYEDMKKWYAQLPGFLWYYPFPYGGNLVAGFRRTVTDTRLAYEAGLKGGEYEHDVGTTVGSGFSEAMWWVLYQVYRNPNSDWRSLRDEWFDWGYGAASEEMKRFSDELEDKLASTSESVPWCGGGLSFAPGRLLEFDALFDCAERRVAADGERLQRVREARINLDVELIARAKELRKIRADFDLVAVFGRVNETIDRAMAIRETSSDLKNKVNTLYFLANVDPKPLPREFDGIPEDRIVQVFPSGFHPGHSELLDDPDAAVRKAARENPQLEPDPFATGYPCCFYDRDNNRQFHATIPVSRGDVGAYRFYKVFDGVEIPNKTCSAITGKSWFVQASAARCYRPMAIDRWDIWVELKFQEDGGALLSRTVFVRRDEHK